jgi:hypothetical protein
MHLILLPLTTVHDDCANWFPMHFLHQQSDALLDAGLEKRFESPPTSPALRRSVTGARQEPRHTRQLNVSRQPASRWVESEGAEALKAQRLGRPSDLDSEQRREFVGV